MQSNESSEALIDSNGFIRSTYCRNPAVSAGEDPATQHKSKGDPMAPSSTSLVQRSYASSSNTGSTNPPELSLQNVPKLRKSGFFGGIKKTSWRASQKPMSFPPEPMTAWTLPRTVGDEYDLAPLLEGNKVSELWTESGNLIVNLFPESSTQSPSFRFLLSVISSSRHLMGLCNKVDMKRRYLGDSDAIHDTRGPVLAWDGEQSRSTVNFVESRSTSRSSSPSYTSQFPMSSELYFLSPLASDDTLFESTEAKTEALINIRNLFAFLTGKPLVATSDSPDAYAVLLNLSELVERFEFSDSVETIDSMSGAKLWPTSRGEVVSTSIHRFMRMYNITDFHTSCEKTVQGLILAERLRCSSLYYQAFTHAAGRYSAIKAVDPTLFHQISTRTRQELEKSDRDLHRRLDGPGGVEDHLRYFEFPSLFAGIGSSTTTEYTKNKIARFGSWKSNFQSMRKFVLSYYKDFYGEWPPHADNKSVLKGEGRLNRIVLRHIFRDFCDLFDLLANKKVFTNRTTTVLTKFGPETAKMADALRKLLDEFDRSKSPDLPPIPNDIPIIPAMTILEPRHLESSEKDQLKASTRKLKSYESELLMAKTHNWWPTQKTSAFLESFLQFEKSESQSKTCQELVDQVCGRWILIYAVLQSLPTLIVDAPGIDFSDGIQYFLCQAISQEQVDEWRTIGDSGHIIRFPSHVPMQSVQGVHRRSHCWIMAHQWLKELSGQTTTLDFDSPLFLAPECFDVNSAQEDMRSSKHRSGPNHTHLLIGRSEVSKQWSPPPSFSIHEQHAASKVSLPEDSIPRALPPSRNQTSLAGSAFKGSNNVVFPRSVAQDQLKTAELEGTIPKLRRSPATHFDHILQNLDMSDY